MRRTIDGFDQNARGTLVSILSTKGFIPRNQEVDCLVPSIHLLGILVPCFI